MPIEPDKLKRVLNEEVAEAVEVLRNGGLQLQRNLSAVMAYTERAQRELSDQVGDADYEGIWLAKRDAVILYAAVQAIDGADTLDESARVAFIHTIGMVLRVGAALL
jgi:hypothetical protein